MYLAVIVLPLLGSIVSGFLGRKVGVSGAQAITSISVISTTIFAILIFFEVSFNNITVNISLCRWLDMASINILWGFNFDFLTVSMLIPVLIISSLVHIYSIGYMSNDPHNQRFFSYLSLFTFMMVILVTSNNFLLMFVGWEGVGICSYLLVNFWFTRIAANQSSISALLTNRVGDCFLTIGMFVILLSFGNLDYTTVFSIAPFVSENSITIIGVCLLIGAMAKSSQIGLHVWLPLAMEGPTPVSALIHAATMVTAGVYLLIRTSPLLEYTSTVLLACLWIGSVTTVFSSVVGLFQQDIKKVIAYSTMSQLGMMVIAIGLSCYNLALFHLVNHAFYKGLLFLAAGAVIHAVADNQDFRKYGGLILFLPLTYTVMLIASLSLVAFPFMTGFYSKDFILESCFSQFNYAGVAVYFTAVIGAVFTTLYSAKILYLTFLANPNAPSITYNKAHESDIYMSLPLVILALFSIYFGYLTKDLFIGLATHAFNDNSIFIHPTHEVYISSEFAVSSFYKLLPFFLTIFTFTASAFIFEIMPKLIIALKYTRLIYNIFSYLNLKFLVESLYNRFVTYFILSVGGSTTKVLDKGFVEKLGPYGLERFLTLLSRNLNALSTGVVTTYALYILLGFMLYVSLMHLLSDSLTLFIIMFSGVSYTFYKSLPKKKVEINMSRINFTVKSSIDLENVMTGIKWTAGLLLIPVLVAGTRKAHNYFYNNGDYTKATFSNIPDKVESADSAASVSTNSPNYIDTILSGFTNNVYNSEYSPIKWLSDTGITLSGSINHVYNNNYSPVKWLSDTGDVAINHPYYFCGIFVVLGAGFLYCIHLSFVPDTGSAIIKKALTSIPSYKSQNPFQMYTPACDTWPSYRHFHDDGIPNAAGNIVNSANRFSTIRLNPNTPMDGQLTHQVMDQHLTHLYYDNVVLLARALRLSCAQKYYHANPDPNLPGHYSTVINQEIVYWIKNFTWLPDWSNTGDGRSHIPGFFEFVAHFKQVPLKFEDFPFYMEFAFTFQGLNII